MKRALDALIQQTFLLSSKNSDLWSDITGKSNFASPACMAKSIPFQGHMFGISVFVQAASQVVSPRKLLFFIIYNIFSRLKYPTNIKFNFENRSTAQLLNRTPTHFKKTNEDCAPWFLIQAYRATQLSHFRIGDALNSAIQCSHPWDTLILQISFLIAKKITLGFDSCPPHKPPSSLCISELKISPPFGR